MKVEDTFKLEGKFILTLKDLEGNVVQTQESKNLVVTVGKEVFARLLMNDQTYSGFVNYVAVGTDGASPAVGDTQLGAEIDRSELEDSNRVGTQTTLEYVFSATQAIGDLKEIGAFIDATDTPNSGIMFDSANIDIIKTPLNSLVVQLVITVV